MILQDFISPYKNKFF